MAASSAKKAVAKKVAGKKSSAGKPVAKKAPAKKAVKKAAPKKATAKKAAPKKVVKKAPAKKAAPKKAVKKAPAKKAAPKKAVKKAPVKKATPAKAAPKKAPEKKPTKPVAPKTAAPKKEATKKAPAVKEAKVVVAPVPVPPPAPVINPIGGTAIPEVRKAVPGKKAAPKQPVVQEDESNWSKTELNQVRKILEKDAAELEIEIHHAEESFEELIFESGEGAGDDQADAGTKTFEREQEISILANKRDLLDQTHHALERIAAGTYGRCENCGNPIGKLRLLEANPRATLCMPCRQKEDRG